MLLEEDLTDAGAAVVVGGLGLTNPNLARRLQDAHPLNELDRATRYTHGASGYTDYTELEPFAS